MGSFDVFKGFVGVSEEASSQGSPSRPPKKGPYQGPKK